MSGAELKELQNFAEMADGGSCRASGKNNGRIEREKVLERKKARRFKMQK